MDLASEQADMRARWAGVRTTTDDLMPDRTVVCRFCRINPGKVNKRTGEVYPCRTCCVRRVQLRLKYNLTLEQYFTLLRKQNHKCAICLAAFSEMNSPNVDHCDEMHRVRGLLCRNCNTGIGALQEDESIMQAAINYLQLNMLPRC